ncbi:MAG TPA: hypothetical protein VFE55_02065 [Acidimicrobiia bacterium]|nr:hypothetical protein [Acidimicrobiia bacterium]
MSPPTRPDPGVEANRRLSSVTGMVLLVLLAIQGYTVPQVHRLLSLHVFIGLLLVGPVLLKTASTLYRFVRYYRGDRAYRDSGPPLPLLRIIGPVVIVSTFTLLGSGLALIVAGPAHRDVFLKVHQASFILWFVTMTVHVLGHVREAARATWREIRTRADEPTGRRRGLRVAVIVAALAVGIGLAGSLVPRAAHWTDDRFEAPGQAQKRLTP